METTNRKRCVWEVTHIKALLAIRSNMGGATPEKAWLVLAMVNERCTRAATKTCNSIQQHHYEKSPKWGSITHRPGGKLRYRYCESVFECIISVAVWMFDTLSSETISSWFNVSMNPPGDQTHSLPQKNLQLLQSATVDKYSMFLV